MFNRLLYFLFQLETNWPDTSLKSKIKDAEYYIHEIHSINTTDKEPRCSFPYQSHTHTPQTNVSKETNRKKRPNPNRIWLYKILQRINLIGIFLKTNKKKSIAKCQLFNNKKSYQGRKNRKGLQEGLQERSNLYTHTKCMGMVYLLVHTKTKEPHPHKNPFVPAQ